MGHARTFYQAWKRARDAGGVIVMRMEDLDRDRSRREYADAAYEDLRWLGLDWDEGPDVGGSFGPYLQSLRHESYVAEWRRLREGGFVYPCRCSRKDLAAALSAPHEGAPRELDPMEDSRSIRERAGYCVRQTSGPAQRPTTQTGGFAYPMVRPLSFSI